MTTTTKPSLELRTLRLDEITIRPGFNPRQTMDEDELDRLAASIKRKGVIQPLLVAARESRYDLLGGHRRYAAAQRAGRRTVPAYIRHDDDSADDLEIAVLDNSHGVSLNPLEEAIAYGRLRDQGRTPAGIAKELTVPQKRVTERLRILKLPETIRHHIAIGTISTTRVPYFAELAQKSSTVASVLADAEAEDPGTIDDGFAIRRALEPVPDVIDPGRIEPEAHFKLTPELRKQLKTLQESYGGVLWGGKIRLREQELDAARAANALLEIPCGSDRRGQRPAVPVIADREWVQENVPPLIEKEYTAYVKRADRKAEMSRKATADAEKERAAKRQQREEELRNRAAARERNAQLGRALMNKLASVPLSTDAAKFLCLSLLEPMAVPSYYAPSHPNERTSRLAGRGLRLVLPDWQQEITLKNGKTKTSYLTDDAELEKRFWEWWNLARAPEEVIGRTIIALAAAHYADEDATLKSERIWFSFRGHRDALRHLEAIVDPKLPTHLRKRKRTQRNRRAESSRGVTR